MKYRHQFLALLAIALILGLGMAFTRPSQQPQHPRPQNLKVLPKDIDHASLIKIMHDFSEALGFRCVNCHVAKPNGDMDFASDAKPEKREAREMMRMMKKINRKYFGIKGNFVDVYMNAKITCYSCHHGQSHPAVAASHPEGQQQLPPPPPPASRP
ncbi:MAG: c-type cytochrome [Thermoflavifilum aggregans]|nr:c-type cytochrome [Thermoflavifilum aggregans]